MILGIGHGRGSGARQRRRLTSPGHLITLTATALGCLALAPLAGASGFRTGLVAPVPVPAAAAHELGTSLQRYDLPWHGEATYTGTLALAPSTAPVLATYPASARYSAAIAPAYCSWVLSIARRYPWVRYYIVGNEPRLGEERGYAAVLRVCAPLLHQRGLYVVGPGLHPMAPRYAQVMLSAIGPGLLDAFDYHPYWYSSLSYDRDIVQRVHTTLGANVAVWVTEDGVQGWDATYAALYGGSDRWYTLTEAGQGDRIIGEAAAARCAGLSAWFNFMYQDEVPTWPGWQSGVVRPDGSHKAAYAALAYASHSTACSEAVRDPLPPPRHPSWRGPRCATDACPSGRYW